MKNRLLFILLFTSTLVMAQLTGLQRGELVFKNAAKNPSFEQSTRGWTNSGSGTFSIDTTDVRSGSGSGLWNPAAASDKLSSALVQVPTGDGACLAEFYYYGFGTADVRYWVENNSGTVLGGYSSTNTAYVISSSGTKFTRAIVPFSCPISGVTVKLVLEAQGNAAAADIDDVYIGRDFRVGMGEIHQYLGAITTTSTLTNTTITANYWRQGDKLIGSIKILCIGTPAGATATLTLPNSWTVDTSKLQYDGNTVSIVGKGTLNDASTTTTYTILVRQISGSPTTLGFLMQDDAAAGLVGSTLSNTSPVTLVINDTIAFNFEVPIVGWTAENIVRGDATAQSWTGYFDSTCGGWTRTNASYGDPATDASCALVERDNTNFGTVSAVAGILPGITWTPKKTGETQACIFAYGAPNITAVGATICAQVLNGAGTQLGESCQTGLVTTSYQMFGACVKVDTVAGTAQTLKLQTKASAGQITLGGNGGSAIEWALTDITQPGPAPFIPGSAFFGRSNVAKIGTTGVSCSAGSSIVNNSDLMVSSIGNVSSGACTITLATGYFSAAPICTVSNVGTAGTPVITSVSIASATSIAIDAASDAGTASSSYSAYLTCIGDN